MSECGLLEGNENKLCSLKGGDPLNIYTEGLPDIQGMPSTFQVMNQLRAEIGQDQFLRSVERGVDLGNESRVRCRTTLSAWKTQRSLLTERAANSDMRMAEVTTTRKATLYDKKAKGDLPQGFKGAPGKRI